MGQEPLKESLVTTPILSIALEAQEPGEAQQLSLSDCPLSPRQDGEDLAKQVLLGGR